MKRLILLALLFLSSTANAANVVVQQYVSNNDVTINRLNSNMNAIVNQVNGNLEGGGINIKPGSITSIDLNTTVSTITRWSESFNDFTVSGMLPATSANLASDISAGVSYVSGYRVATAATNHTYTASKDTYVYISNGGYFIYQEVANGASAPSTPTNSLLLAKVVTNGTAITSVSDLRQLSIQITATTSNFPSDYRNQSFVSRDTTTTLHAEPGQISIGTSIYSRSTDTLTKSIALSTNWIESSVPATNGNIFIYAYNDSGSSWDIKFSSADVVYSDLDGNSNGILRYYITGGVNYRAIGWAYKSADAVQIYQFGNFSDISTPSIASRKSTTDVVTASTSAVNDGEADLTFYSSGKPITINWTAAVINDSSSVTRYGIMIDNVDITETQSGAVAAAASPGSPASGTWTGILARGTHKIQGRFWVASGVGTVDSRIIEIKEL